MPFFGVPIRNGLPIGLGSVAGFGVQQFDPSQLFQGGTVAGAWYDPSDLSTLFTSSSGTTPVSMPGLGAAVPVGLMLDKSQGLVLGPELVTNGTFVSNVNGWTLTIQSGGTGTFTWDAGKGRLTVVGTFVHQVNQGISVTAGKWYKITGERFLVSGAATSSVSIRDSTDPVTSVVLGGAVVNAGASSDSFSLYYLATSTTTVYLAFRNGNNGAITDIDNISVRELPGNHAIAFNNTTARPELRARVNLLVATATLSTQSVTTQATSYTLSFAGTGSITLSGTATGSYSAGTHTITCTAGTLTLTVSGTVTTADLRPANSGALLPAYQAVVDANTYDTSGFPLYLRFDGIDDGMSMSLAVSTLNLSAFAGVRETENSSNNNRYFFIGDATGSVNNVGGFINGQTAASSSIGYRLPENEPVFTVLGTQTSAVISYQRTSTTLQTARLNGIAATSNTNLTTTFTSAIGRIGCSVSASANATFFPGNIYSLIIAGSAVSAGNISATEQWVAGRTGIQI